MIANRGNFRHVAYAFKTDVGKKRKNNEDALGAFPEGGIFCVADGMGGGDDGEIASAAVVKAVDDVSRRCSTGAGHDAKDVAAVLEAGLSDASAWIWKRASAKKISVCGSTFVGVILDSTVPAKALAIHAGDSRIYVIRGNKVKQITRDHSASELMGEKDESKVNPLFRSMIVNAVGIRKTVECERTPFKVAAGDRILVCSDGLYRMVDDRRIGEVSAANADVEKAVDALVAAALDGGGVDNVSVVLCEIGELPDPIAASPVPAAVNDVSEATRTTGDGGDMESSEVDETRETMIPVLDGKINGADGSEALPTKRRRAVWKPLMYLGLALAIVFVVAILVSISRRQEPETVVPVLRRTEPTFPNIVATVANEVETATNEAVAVANEASTVSDETATIADETAEADDEAVAYPDVEPLEAAVQEDAFEPNASVEPPDSVQTTDVVVQVATNQVAAHEPSAMEDVRPSPKFVAACDLRSVADFAESLKRMCGIKDPASEIEEQLRRFRESARLCSRMRSEKYVLNAVVDLKYVLTAAVAAMDRIEGEDADELICKFVDDWNLVTSGSEKDLAVQEACARIILNAPHLKLK